MLRRILEFYLVTPSRRLARRVKAELWRWSIEVNDTAGEPLAETAAGGFLRLILELGLSRFGARELAQLLKHPLFRFGRDRRSLSHLVAALEISLLRGAAEPRGIEGLKAEKLEKVLKDEDILVREAAARAWLETGADREAALRALLEDKRLTLGAASRRWTGSSPTTSAPSPGRWAVSPPTRSTRRS